MYTYIHSCFLAQYFKAPGITIKLSHFTYLHRNPRELYILLAFNIEKHPQISHRRTLFLSTPRSRLFYFNNQIVCTMTIFLFCIVIMVYLILFLTFIYL